MAEEEFAPPKERIPHIHVKMDTPYKGRVVRACTYLRDVPVEEFYGARALGYLWEEVVPVYTVKVRLYGRTIEVPVPPRWRGKVFQGRESGEYLVLRRTRLYRPEEVDEFLRDAGVWGELARRGVTPPTATPTVTPAPPRAEVRLSDEQIREIVRQLSEAISRVLGRPIGVTREVTKACRDCGATFTTDLWIEGRLKQLFTSLSPTPHFKVKLMRLQELCPRCRWRKYGDSWYTTLADYMHYTHTSWPEVVVFVGVDEDELKKFLEREKKEAGITYKARDIPV